MTVAARIRSLAGYLARVEIWVVFAAIAVSFVWPRLLLAAVITAAFFWPVRRIALGYFSLRTPGDWGIVLLLVMVPITLWATSLPDKTQIQVYRLLSGIALYYAIVNGCNSSRRLRILVSGICLAGLGLALIAPVSVRWPAGKLPFIPNALYQGFLLVPADTIHPNVIAGTLVLILPVALAWLLFAWKELGRLERFLTGLAVLATTSVVALTQSRGAWLALGAGLVLLFVLRWRWGWIGLGLVAGAFIVLVNRFGVRSMLEEVTLSGTAGGLDGRLEIWSRAMDMIRDFPFTGIGMGSFKEAADALYPFFRYSPDAVDHAHNLFLQIAVDLGIAGLVAWLAILLTIVMSAWLLYRRGCLHKNVQCAAIGAGVLGSLLALVVHGMTDAVTWGMVRPAPVVWAIWGLAIGARYVCTRSGKMGRPGSPAQAPVVVEPPDDSPANQVDKLSSRSNRLVSVCARFSKDRSPRHNFHTSLDCRTNNSCQRMG
jgi:putative inorganic carbon (hco3(-)) transporter